MTPFRIHQGLVTLLDRPNTDTDQIIPKQFLKRIERTGFGKYLFYDWRFLEEGRLNPDFEMNAERYKGASILLTRANFGCGSSREHAPWAILDYGIRCILAPSFADIFHNNCFKNGMLPITLSAETIELLFQTVRATPGFQLCVDLESQQIGSETGFRCAFDMDPHPRHCLLNGLDDISQTLKSYSDQIDAYEKRLSVVKAS